MVRTKNQKNLLLCGNGILNEPRFLAIAEPWLKELFALEPGKKKKILYVAYALNNIQKNAAKVAEALSPLGIEVVPAKIGDDPAALLNQVEGVIVGGGNSYTLYEKLQQTKLGAEIMKKVATGMPYMGLSAGAVMACPSIETTLDPVPSPHRQSDYHGLGLIDFQIAPHYSEHYNSYWLQGHANTTETPIIGLRDNTALRVQGTKMTLLGADKTAFFKPEPGRDESPKLEFNEQEDSVEPVAPEKLELTAQAIQTIVSRNGKRKTR
jgi:dipeptidase E